jgi:hypothetical protein
MTIVKDIIKAVIIITMTTIPMGLTMTDTHHCHETAAFWPVQSVPKWYRHHTDSVPIAVRHQP